MKICKNPSDAEFYVESNGQIKNGGLVLHFLSYEPFGLGRFATFVHSCLPLRHTINGRFAAFLRPKHTNNPVVVNYPS